MHDKSTEGLIVGHTRKFARGTQTPFELVDACLRKIEAHNPILNALIHVDEPSARDSAALSTDRWRRFEPLSPIDGIPIVIKANMAMAGAPWTAGMGVHLDRVADHDAACVARLKAAGAILIGVANMDEGALGASGDNVWHGAVEHPTDKALRPGGSSGGSATAVAAGFCLAALGSDTMGSVRIPAAYCGLVGYKPSHGLIDASGVTPLAPSFDAVGVVAKTVNDCEAVAQILTDQPLEFTLPASPRLAVLDGAGAVDVEPAIATAFERRIDEARSAGIAIERIETPDLARLQRLLLMAVEIEGAAVHAAAMADRPEAFSADFLKMLAWGAGQPSTRLDAIRLEMASLAQPILAAVQACDAVVYPTLSHQAFPVADAPRPDQAAFTALASALGLPAIATPIGNGAGSVQIMARDDAGCLAIARLLLSR